ncbi:hypothetical protein EDC01DRAFT_81168 [Geopyxis carbonaria]|nr:hypothetical protein EDC01DRAFT_81168 [Geopyxis carbonaria]
MYCVFSWDKHFFYHINPVSVRLYDEVFLTLYYVFPLHHFPSCLKPICIIMFSLLFLYKYSYTRMHVCFCGERGRGRESTIPLFFPIVVFIIEMDRCWFLFYCVFHILDKEN